MRRLFIALPLLLALVVGVLPGPSARSTATASTTDPVGTVGGWVSASDEAPYHVQFRLWERAESGEWVPTPYRGAVSVTHELGWFRIDDVPPGTYRLEVQPLATFFDSHDPMHRLAGPRYFAPDADTVEGGADAVVTAGSHTSVAVALRRPHADRSAQGADGDGGWLHRHLRRQRRVLAGRIASRRSPVVPD